jgi:cell division protein FtsW
VKKILKPADKWLLFAVMSLMFMSLVIVYSASASWAELKFQNAAYLLRSHLFKVFVGMVLIFVFAKFDYHKLERPTFSLLVVSGFLLATALIQGVVIKGAARWIHLGIISFEPSEIARLTVLLFVAAYLAENYEKLNDYRTFIRPIAITAIFAVLVLLEPNFSTALMTFVVVGVMLFVGGAKKSHLAVLLIGVLVIGCGAMMIESYRVARVQSWIRHGSGNYQVQQSVIGFGNGGILGVGPGNSRQRNLFLPESYGDFIYSIIGEEYGLWGSVLIMLFYLFIAFRGTAIAKKAPDQFGVLLATGITSEICLYAFVNAAVATGLFPTTGLPMPFISYGGTAMIVNSVCVGIILNISKQIPMQRNIPVADDSESSTSEIDSTCSEPVVGRIY